MSLTVFNGSPRGQSSNSTVIAKWFLLGYGQSARTYYLNKFKEVHKQVEAFEKASSILMVFPLYVDGMPGQVKAFFEALVPYKESIQDKRITFIIHSGFTEGIHSRGLETYLNHFAKSLGLRNHGVIIIPGSEGFRLMPPIMTKKKSEGVIRLAKAFSLGEPYSSKDLKTLMPTESFSRMGMLGFRVAKFFGLTNLHWNSQLRKYGVFKKRFDAPYDHKPVEITTDAYLKNY